jgi:predicted nucleotidyltransferase component of viral defense system
VSLSKERIEHLAADTGFKQDMLEKASHLIDLLSMIAEDDYLKDRVVLKGGTALNLFYFDLPRLSIDIDLNYIGSLDAAVMQKERDQIERVLDAMCKRLQLQLAKLPDEYACRKYTATYHSFFSGRGNLQVDINYLHRVTYWEPERKNSCAFDGQLAKNMPVISLYELAGGKLAALLARTASRDLFDIAQLSTLLSSDDQNLRLAYVIYGAKQPKDWRTVTAADITVSAQELAERLIPVLKTSIVQSISSPIAYAEELLTTCKKFVSPFFPLTDKEAEFIQRLRQDGNIDPSLLTDDPAMAEHIKQDPPLLWRASKAGS